MIFFEYMVTCPKCKLIIRDLIKAHFLNGAVSNPIPIYLGAIDPIYRDNMYSEGPYPIAPTDSHRPRYSPITPTIHGRSIITIPSLTVPSRPEAFESGSYTLQYLMTHLGVDFKPPLVSSITTRFGKEVLETAHRVLGR